MNKKAIALPALNGDTKLPVILNRHELKELLGHSQITTTMIYLHVAQFEYVKPHSPLPEILCASSIKTYLYSHKNVLIYYVVGL